MIFILNKMKSSRNTKQKEIITTQLNKITSFFNAEQLHEKVKKQDPTIGLATIYRYLSEAKKNNELFSYMCNRKQIYSKGTKSHCHFICEQTGKVIHFEIDNIDFLKNKIPGTITSFQIEVKGTRQDCKTL